MKPHLVLKTVSSRPVADINKYINSLLTHKTDLQNSDTIVLFKVILASSPSDASVDEVVDSRANYQGYRYNFDFLQCHTFKAMHIENGEGVY